MLGRTRKPAVTAYEKQKAITDATVEKARVAFDEVMARASELAIAQRVKMVDFDLARNRIDAQLSATARDTPSLLDRLRELEARKAAIADELLCLRPIPRLPAQLVTSRLEEWRRRLRESTAKGRLVLERVLAGRIVFTPNREGTAYDFEAPTRFDKLFAGVAMRFPSELFPDDGDMTGACDIRAEETWDVDYEQLLARVQRVTEKGVASPPGFEPGFQP